MSTNQSSTSTNYEITGGSQNITYKFASDVEYFQVITATTVGDYHNISKNLPNGDEVAGYGSTYSNSFAQRYLFGWQRVTKSGGDNPDEYPDDSGNELFETNVPNIRLNTDWKNLVIVFLVRGVDVNTPKQDVEYELTKIIWWNIIQWFG